MKSITNKLVNGAAVSIIGMAAVIFMVNNKRSKTMNKAEVKVNTKKLDEVRQARKKEGMPVTGPKILANEKDIRADVLARELTARFNGMTMEEKEMIADLMPIDLCMKRIQKELDKAKEFENRVKLAMADLK